MNMKTLFKIILPLIFSSANAHAQTPTYNSATHVQNIATSARDQKTYFDLELFKEIIDGAQSSEGSSDQEQRIAQTAQKLSDFFTSTSFAFNEEITSSILKNAELYVEILRDRRTHFQIFHPKAGLITDPKFGVDLVPNINFIRALMRVQSAALRDIAESAQKVINVMAYSDRNTSSDAAIIYHHCIMVAAVGVNHSNCVKDNDIQLSKDKEAIAKFERAYMISYRISRLAFIRFHDVIKLLADTSVVRQSIEVQLHVEKDPGMIRYSSSAVTEEQYKQMTIFKVSQIEALPECQDMKSKHKVIKDIFKSQLGCTTGPLFGFDTCFRQHSEENRRKVSVLTLGLEFASLFYQSPIDEDRESDYKFIKLKSVCPVDARYHYVVN